MDEEKQVLINQQTAGDALREIQNHQGWPELVNILSDLYKENLTSLITKEDLEARAMLKALDNLATQIRLKIEFGKVAAEELKTTKFNINTPDTP